MVESTGDLLENKPILKSDQDEIDERSCDLINGLTSKFFDNSSGGVVEQGRGARGQFPTLFLRHHTTPTQYYLFSKWPSLCLELLVD